MPELPEVEATRRRLVPAMAGARIVRVRLNRADLRVPFPHRFAERLRGQTVEGLRRRGKYLLADLSSGDTLVMHLGMSGSFMVEPADRRRRPTPDADLERRHDHVVFVMSSGQTVTFNDPRRFGLMTIVERSEAGSPAPDAVALLGPEPLEPAFTAATLAASCRMRRVAIKVALLDQKVVAGLGNIYASEALHLARLSPFRPASSLVAATGRPRAELVRLVPAIKSVLRRAIGRTDQDRYRGSRFRVYDREGDRCMTPGCRGAITCATQAGRSTYYCPVCQR